MQRFEAMASKAVDFATFLEKSGIKPATVARETGLHRSTIIRIRDGAEPTYGNMRLLEHWAERTRRRQKLSVRLSWSYLLSKTDGAAA